MSLSFLQMVQLIDSTGLDTSVETARKSARATNPPHNVARTLLFAASTLCRRLAELEQIHIRMFDLQSKAAAKLSGIGL